MRAELTREEAIQGHRTMWNWIAEQLETMAQLESDVDTMNAEPCYLAHLKEEWCIKNGYVDKEGFVSLKHECFCCEYDNQNGDSKDTCAACPLIWGTEKYQDHYFCEHRTERTLLLYPEHKRTFWTLAKNFCYNRRFADAAVIARRIANLPEKPMEPQEKLVTCPNCGRKFEEDDFHVNIKNRKEETYAFCICGWDESINYYEEEEATCWLKPTVEQVIERLQKLPKDMEVNCCGSGYVHLHVTKKGNACSFDTETNSEWYGKFE